MRSVLAVRHRREELGLSQNDLADLTYTTQATISLIERGHLRPDDELLNRLASVLGVSPPFMLLQIADSGTQPTAKSA